MGITYGRRGRTDFGELGDSSTTTSSTSATATPASSGGLTSVLNSILGTGGSSSSGSKSGGSSSGSSGSGGITGSLGSMCGCASNDAAAAAAKKAQLAQQYPQQNCGTTPVAACTAANAQMQALSDSEFAAWQQAQDATTAANLSPTDKANFATINSLAQALLVQDPPAGAMTLNQIETTYPNDFAAVYTALQAQFPFLQNVPAATALAMNPTLGAMTLNQLIQRSGTLSLGTTPTAQTGNSMLLIAGVGVAALGVALFSKIFSRD